MSAAFDQESVIEAPGMFANANRRPAAEPPVKRGMPTGIKVLLVFVVLAMAGATAIVLRPLWAPSESAMPVAMDAPAPADGFADPAAAPLAMPEEVATPSPDAPPSAAVERGVIAEAPALAGDGMSDMTATAPAPAVMAEDIVPHTAPMEAAPSSVVPATPGAADARLVAMTAEMAVLKKELATARNDIAEIRGQLPYSRSDVRRPPPAPVKPRPAAAAAPAKAVPAVDVSGFKLKAVVDGQAWIETRAGETLTVGVGDAVTGIGQVSGVDSQRGEVRFATGAVLR